MIQKTRPKLSIYRNKKGIMGIETLIIFIAMLLVAAIAAGVVLKTAGALQQRALLVGNEARERLATGLDVAQVTGNANTVIHTINEIEFLVRLQAGSNDLQLKTTTITFNLPHNFYTARLMHKETNAYRRVDIPFLDNQTWFNVGNLDMDELENIPDFVSIVYNVTSTTDGLQFNLSDAGNFIVDLGVSLTGSHNINIVELPIRPMEGNIYTQSYGFITLQGTANTTGVINESAGLTLYLETDSNICSWDRLIPNYRYCYVVKFGDADTTLETGEILVFRYKLSEENTLGTDMTFDVNFIPKRGNILNLLIYTPEVFGRTVMTLWP